MINLATSKSRQGSKELAVTFRRPLVFLFSTCTYCVINKKQLLYTHIMLLSKKKLRPNRTSLSIALKYENELEIE